MAKKRLQSFVVRLFPLFDDGGYDDTLRNVCVLIMNINASKAENYKFIFYKSAFDVARDMLVLSYQMLLFCLEVLNLKIVFLCLQC